MASKKKKAAKREPVDKPRRGRGRPEGGGFHPTENDRATVRLMAGYRVPEDEMVLVIINPATGKPISPVTLRKHFAEEIRTGFVTIKMRVMAATVRDALGEVDEKTGKVTRAGNVTAQIWLGKALFGMREKIDVEPPPAPTEAGEQNTLDAARRVAFTLAMGASIATRRKST